MRQEEDLHYIQEALTLADSAARNGEVPVGAIIVKDSVVIARGSNSPIANHDPSAHAEIIALRQACRQISNYRLTDATLYVTLEPCIMCMGAIIHARIDRLVFGAYDPKTGAAGSCYNIGGDNILNHRLEITGGICETQCGDMLRSFFRNKRKKRKNEVKK
jgi:tRNA(adenine34) deaminase